MHLKSSLGRLTQLRNARPGLWLAFVTGWLNRQKGFVPCVVPGCRELLLVPLMDFYESYEFFCEVPQGRRELAYFMAQLKPGDVLYDIGAFRGAFSAASKLKLQQDLSVHAFEPIAASVEAVGRIRELNHFSDFAIVARAVGDGGLSAAKISDEDGMLRAGDFSGPGKRTEIRTVSLDQYVGEGNPAPSIIKIDVEGYEMQVLTGARQFFKKSRPRLWLEVHPEFLRRQKISPDDVLNFLREIGYTISFFDDKNLPGAEVSYHVWCV